jgi:hypothetical protein
LYLGCNPVGSFEQTILPPEPADIADLAKTPGSISWEELHVSSRTDYYSSHLPRSVFRFGNQAGDLALARILAHQTSLGETVSPPRTELACDNEPKPTPLRTEVPAILLYTFDDERFGDLCTNSVTDCYFYDNLTKYSNWYRLRDSEMQMSRDAIDLFKNKAVKSCMKRWGDYIASARATSESLRRSRHFRPWKCVDGLSLSETVGTRFEVGDPFQWLEQNKAIKEYKEHENDYIIYPLGALCDNDEDPVDTGPGEML